MSHRQEDAPTTLAAKIFKEEGVLWQQCSILLPKSGAKTLVQHTLTLEYRTLPYLGMPDDLPGALPNLLILSGFLLSTFSSIVGPLQSQNRIVKT